MYPKDPFRAAWDYYQQLQNIIPPNEQSFRHGWNAALHAAAQAAEAIERRMDMTTIAAEIPEEIRRLEVEVKT